MTEKIHLQGSITAELANVRFDQALAKLFPDYSRSRLQKWIETGEARLDGKQAKPKDKVHAGQFIEINAVIAPDQRFKAQSIPLDIVHEDNNLLVINKPAGLVVHPAPGNPDQTLLNALLHHSPQLAEIPRAGIIHRLDKDTSGLLVVAKNLKAQNKLVSQLAHRKIQRHYVVLVTGELISGGTIEAPIGRNPYNRLQMAVIENGKPAITHYRIKQRFKGFTLLDVKLETGRTHQIRVHMAWLKHPIVGDQTYGGKPKFPKECSAELREMLNQFKRQALHAQRLGLIHPITEEWVEWTCSIPEDMRILIDLIGLFRNCRGYKDQE